MYLLIIMIIDTFLHVLYHSVKTFLLNISRKSLSKGIGSGVIWVNFSPLTRKYHESLINTITPIEAIDTSEFQIKESDDIIDSNIPRKVVNIRGTIIIVHRGRSGGVSLWYHPRLGIITCVATDIEHW